MTHRIALSARYSPPMTSRLAPLFDCGLSVMKALSANSSSVISLVSCSLPLSFNGLTMETCKTKVFMTCFTMEVVLNNKGSTSACSAHARKYRTT